MFSDTYKEYISRVNLVQDFIEANLGQELSLRQLSEVANFSEFHFHRIFSSITNESLYKFINRLRLEKAANLLISIPKKSITDIALDCGFSDSAVFARSFKKHFGYSASIFKSKISKNCKDSNLFPEYTKINSRFKPQNFPPKWNSQVRVENIEEIIAVYMRYTGPYRNNPKVFQRLIKKLLEWAKERDLFHVDDLKLFSIYHDNPDITEEKHQRTTFCLAVNNDIKVNDEVGKLKIPATKYAIGYFELFAHEFENAWNFMFGHWLPSSGFQADDRPAFELYKNNPDEHPQRKAFVEIYLPIKPL